MLYPLSYEGERARDAFKWYLTVFWVSGSRCANRSARPSSRRDIANGRDRARRRHGRHVRPVWLERVLTGRAGSPRFLERVGIGREPSRRFPRKLPKHRLRLGHLADQAITILGQFGFHHDHRAAPMEHTAGCDNDTLSNSPQEIGF